MRIGAGGAAIFGMRGRCAALARAIVVVPLDGSPDAKVLINHRDPAVSEIAIIAAEPFVLDARLPEGGMIHEPMVAPIPRPAPERVK